jgi:chromate reductase, NAD(P)H dehydrogenase (quinone)
MNILAISGSLRGGSFNTSLLQALAAHVTGEHEWTLLEPSLIKGLPHFDEDDEPEHEGHEGLARMRQLVADADVVVISTPEYNGSVPGSLKNLLDWASRPFDRNPFRNKRVSVLSASDGQFGAVWANNDLRKVLGTLGARVMERQVAIPMAHMQFDAEGQLRSEGMRSQLEQLAGDIVTSIAGASAPQAATAPA